MTADHALAAGAGPSRTVVLSVGSNLGDRLGHLQLALSVLCASGLSCQAVSSVYETDPVGGPEQQSFLNAVLLAASALPGRDILARCQAAEAAAGRVRAERWGPRTLDVDVIACGDEVSADAELTLPHPRAHERAFVLVPWLEVEPNARLPGYGRVAQLPAVARPAGIRRQPHLQLLLPASARAEAAGR
jgi:2-amino-4-hydroxy-6-hydroxymethyldihydropteridine diphosphokinase